MLTRLYAVVLAGAVAVALGCSTAGSNPTTPDLTGEMLLGGARANSTTMWGMWEVTFDPVTGTAEIVPLRQIEFTANVTQFLHPPFSGTNLLRIEIDPASDFATGYVLVDVILTHPFPGLETYTGFDVRGVCIGDGFIAGIADPDILYAGVDDLTVLNADGLSRWFNPTEFTTYGTIFGFTLGKMGTPSYDFTATLNGYKYFCDGLDADDDVAEFFANPACPNPRGLFSAGITLRREYELQFPMPGGSPEYRFQYAVVASWESPDPDPPSSVPDDFPLGANCQEAYCLSALDQSDMYYLGPGDSGGTLRLMARVFDHQGAGSASGVAPEIAAIHLETHGGLITPGGLATFDSTALQAALWAEDGVSATYLLEVEDVEPYGAGEFPVLMVVESADPADYDSGFPGFDYPAGALASYLMAEVAVWDLEPVTVTAIDPDAGNLDATLTGVEVTGTGFLDGAEVSLIKSDDPGVVIEATGEDVTSGVLIICDLDLSESNGAEVGMYHVVVQNLAGAPGQLDDGFTVNEGFPYWWKNIMYASYRGGYNPTATIPDPTSLTLKYSVSAPQSYKYGTPVVAEDKIFFTSHTTFYANSNCRVYAHDLETGALIWNAQINPSNTYVRFQTGFGFYKGDDDVERLIVGGDQIYCFDADSSGTNPSPLWSYDDYTPGDQNWLGTVLCVYEDMVIARGRRYPILYILDITDGSVIHRIDTITTSFESGVSAKDGKVYSNGGTWVECIDIETGTIDWSTQVPAGHNVSHYGPPCIADGRIYFGSYAGYVQCYAIEDDGTYEPGDFIWSVMTPDANPLNGGVAKFGDRLFCAAAFNDSHVYCVIDNGDTGSVAWSSALGYYDADMIVTTTPSYPDGVVIAPRHAANYVYFIDATNGYVIRSINDGQSHRAGAAVVGDYVVYAGASTLRVYQ